MSDEPHPDRARIDKMVDGYFDRMGEEFTWYEGLDPRDCAIDDAMLVTVVTLRDPETGEVDEQIVTYCTSARRYVQIGMLSAALERQKKTMFYDDGDEEADET